MKGIVIVFKRPDAAEGNEARIELIPTNEINAEQRCFRLAVRRTTDAGDALSGDFYVPQYALAELKDQIIQVLASGGE